MCPSMVAAPSSKGCQQRRAQPPNQAPGGTAALAVYRCCSVRGGSDWAEASLAAALDYQALPFHYASLPFALNLASRQCLMDVPKKKKEKKSDRMIYNPNWDSHERRGFCVCGDAKTLTQTRVSWILNHPNPGEVTVSDKGTRGLGET